MSLLYRLLHPRSYHMRWKPKGFDADLHSATPGIHWRGRFFPAARWPEFRDAWKAAHSVLCAAGPSLSTLGNFANAQSEGVKLCGVNGAIRLRDREKIAFDLFMMTDANMAILQWENLVEAFDTSRLIVISPRLALEICRRDPNVLARAPFLLATQPHEPYGAPRPSRTRLQRLEKQGMLLAGEGAWRFTGFSFRPQRGVFAGGTVTVAAIQVLAWFGVSRIAIAGMDLSGGQHFYDRGEAKPSRLLGDYELRIEPALRTAAHAAQQKGFELQNLSPVSRLPENIIPKVPPETAGLRKIQTGCE